MLLEKNCYIYRLLLFKPTLLFFMSVYLISTAAVYAGHRQNRAFTLLQISIIMISSDITIRLILTTVLMKMGELVMNY